VKKLLTKKLTINKKINLGFANNGVREERGEKKKELNEVRA
jgi:hypothetical protein